jgi:hypothetical protein
MRFLLKFDEKIFICKFENKICLMTEIVIDKKKYILIPEKNYQELQKRAALKSKPEKTFTIEEARIYSKKLIKKWAGEK